MMKRFLSFSLAFILLFSFTAPVFAFNDEKHDEYLEQVLFLLGNVPPSGKEQIKMLEYASYLAIDQYNGNGSDKLEALRQYGVKGLPETIESIDFSEGQHHRRYTHQGWDYYYSSIGGKDKANWPVRKEILLSTANKVFDFGIINSVTGNYSDECKSFCALVYYVHILGDHIHDEKPKGSSEQLPFARAKADENTPDFFYELKPHLEVLFGNISSTRKFTYYGLMNKYDVLSRKARSLDATTGGIDTEEEIALLNSYEEELMELLISYVPRLLSRTEFFKQSFK